MPPEPSPDRPSTHVTVTLSLIATVAILACVWWSPAADSGDVAVIVAPWSAKASAAQTVLGAGGRIVASGRWPFIIVARPGEGPAAAFHTRLYRTGALAVLDARLLSGCVTETRP